MWMVIDLRCSSQGTESMTAWLCAPRYCDTNAQKGVETKDPQCTISSPQGKAGTC